MTLTLAPIDFKRLWPVNDAPCFSQLLQAIVEADRELRGTRQPQVAAAPPRELDVGLSSLHVGCHNTRGSLLLGATNDVVLVGFHKHHRRL